GPLRRFDRGRRRASADPPAPLQATSGIRLDPSRLLASYAARVRERRCVDGTARGYRASEAPPKLHRSSTFSPSIRDVVSRSSAGPALHRAAPALPRPITPRGANMARLLHDPTLSPSPRLAMDAPTETLAY